MSNRKTQIALVSPNKFHGAIEDSFDEKQKRNLWRIDALQGKMYLLLLSQAKPDLKYIANQFGKKEDCGETKEYEVLLNRIREDSIWQFRLVANPTHSIKAENGRGIPCRFLYPKSPPPHTAMNTPDAYRISLFTSA